MSNVCDFSCKNKVGKMQVLICTCLFCKGTFVSPPTKLGANLYVNKVNLRNLGRHNVIQFNPLSDLLLPSSYI